jgi:trk system potassium uptake protein TrkA
MKKTILQNKLLVIGCGRLGASIANDASKKGKNVIVVDPDESSFLHLDETFGGITITGNATDFSILERAYIKTAFEVVITTGDDNINIFIAHVCRTFYKVPTIVVRLDDPERGVLIANMKIKPIYPLDLSLSKFYQVSEDNL